MFGTASRNSSGYDFAAFGEKIFKCLWIFVIDYEAGVGTEAANLAAMINSFFSSYISVSSYGCCHFILPPPGFQLGVF